MDLKIDALLKKFNVKPPEVPTDGDDREAGGRFVKHNDTDADDAKTIKSLSVRRGR